MGKGRKVKAKYVQNRPRVFEVRLQLPPAYQEDLGAPPRGPHLAELLRGLQEGLQGLQEGLQEGLREVQEAAMRERLLLPTEKVAGPDVPDVQPKRGPNPDPDAGGSSLSSPSTS